MTRKLLISIAVAASLVECAAPDGVAPGGKKSSTPGQARVAIELPRLPPQGVVVQEDGGLTFLGVDGGPRHTLEPFKSPAAAGAATTQFQDDLELPLPTHPPAVTDLSGCGEPLYPVHGIRSSARTWGSR